MDFLSVRLRTGCDRTSFIRKISVNLRGPSVDEYILERLENGDAISTDRRVAVEKAIAATFPKFLDLEITEEVSAKNHVAKGSSSPIARTVSSENRRNSPTQIETPRQNKRALLVGVNDYHDLEELKFAKKDAEDVANALINYCGFRRSEIDIMTCVSPRRSQATARYVRDRLFKMQNSVELDLFVFGFWGHGVVGDDHGLYLTGVDTDRVNITGTSINFDLIVGAIRQMRPRNSLLILDCCQTRVDYGRSVANKFDQDVEAQVKSAATRLVESVSRSDWSAEIGFQQTSAVLFSCSQGERAFEWESRRNGHFTAHLLDAIASGATRVTDIARIVATETVSSVWRDKGKRQSPWLELKGSGDIELLTTENKA